MSRLVSGVGVEGIVGRTRHPTEHWGRAVSRTREVFILHSVQCRDSGRDLRQCPFSLALDDGIDEEIWAGWEDRPVRLAIEGDKATDEAWLVPDGDRP
jgi:hypothetical protein